MAEGPGESHPIDLGGRRQPDRIDRIGPFPFRLLALLALLALVATSSWAACITDQLVAYEVGGAPGADDDDGGDETAGVWFTVPDGTLAGSYSYTSLSSCEQVGEDIYSLFWGSEGWIGEGLLITVVPDDLFNTPEGVGLWELEWIDTDVQADVGLDFSSDHLLTVESWTPTLNGTFSISGACLANTDPQERLDLEGTFVCP